MFGLFNIYMLTEMYILTEKQSFKFHYIILIPRIKEEQAQLKDYKQMCTGVVTSIANSLLM